MRRAAGKGLLKTLVLSPVRVQMTYSQRGFLRGQLPLEPAPLPPYPPPSTPTNREQAPECSLLRPPACRNEKH